MSTRFIAKPIETAEMSGQPTVGQSFTLSATERHKVLQRVVVGLCVENPTMTLLTLELWSDNAGAPGKLIAASTNSKTRAQLIGTTDNYGFGWYGFEFAGAALRAGSTYWLVLRCTGYTYTANNHIAWRHSYPDPQYRTGVTLTAAKGATHPLECSLIMADL